MELDLWPIVSRDHLVQAFRPGDAVKEGPFRTLRSHGWATPGVSVVTRKNHRASGRITIFSVLNVAAARCAREGNKSRAKALARAAAKVETSASFVQLKQLLSGSTSEVVSATIEGTGRAEFLEALREVACHTRNVRVHMTGESRGLEIVMGTILEELRDGVVLQAEAGTRTLVPRWLAQSAHRSSVGDLLALVTDKLDATHMVVKAMPAIDLGVRVARSPFGRKAPVRSLTAVDEHLFSKTPAAIRVLVPVTIEK
jgi:hypothetical protein